MAGWSAEAREKSLLKRAEKKKPRAWPAGSIEASLEKLADRDVAASMFSMLGLIRNLQTQINILAGEKLPGRLAARVREKIR